MIFLRSRFLWSSAKQNGIVGVPRFESFHNCTAVLTFNPLTAGAHDSKISKIGVLRIVLTKIVIIFAIAGSANVMAEAVGRVAFLQGDVHLKSSLNGQLIQPVLGMDVSEKDHVVTGNTGRIKILMGDDNEINVFSGTDLEIRDYATEGEKRTVLLRLESGKVRLIVKQTYDGTLNKFQVQTPSASTSVHGTDFVVKYISALDSSTIVTFTGAVQIEKELKPSDAEKSGLVNAGQSAELRHGKMESPPKDLNKDDLAQADRDTNMSVAPPPIDKPAAAKSGSGKKKRHKAISQSMED
jgi:hypothetical protein